MYSVLIYGTGSGSKKVTHFLKDDEINTHFKIIAYVDKIIKKDNFMGLKVISVDEIKKIEYDYVLIASDFYKEIIPNLIKVGVNSEKIIPFFDSAYWINYTNDVADILLNNMHKCSLFPVGHFYSTIPSMKEVKEEEKKIFCNNSKIEGVDLNEKQQLELFNIIKEYYKDMPFQNKKISNLRYHFGNDAFEYADAIILYSMLRNFQPQKVIEVGSGYSSAVMLDTNELFLNDKVEFTFIEPFPQTIKSVLRIGDFQKNMLINKRLQDVDLEIFKQLESNDILFIDSTHVSKINSDVNYIFFNILPILKEGVIIHFHDIFYPFEYPKEWIYKGIYWNEAYMLRAFLQYNHTFKVIFFNTYMESKYRNQFEEYMPECLKNEGGSIWIKKVK
jgi:hypothetical protein